jgi:anthranilate phosphoribosyltransferase
VPESSFPSLEELGGWAGVLGRVAHGDDLGATHAGAVLAEILAGDASPVHTAAFVFGLRCKGETVAEMTGMVRAMLDASEAVVVPGATHDRLVDTCGTGGDRSGSINVSTVAALVVAGAGVPVCKHGGRSASSLAGSADLLEALGVVIELGPEGVARCIAEAGIGFCFAPRYHRAMRHAVPVRRELGVATVFNFLGPLANPARVRRQVVGVGDPAMARTMVGVLAGNGARHVAVVHGADGLDELSTTGPSMMLSWERGDDTPAGADSDGSDGAADADGHAAGGADLGRIVTRSVDPGRLGLAPATLADLRGGDATANATYARRILAAERGAHRDIVLLNAAAGLLVGGVVDDLGAGIAMAATSIDDGAAARTLDRLVAVSQDCAGM